MEQALLSFAHTTGIYAFMHSAWGWPVVESLHFTGLCLLIGTVGVFDLRLLGLAPGVPIDALHRLVPLGVAGFIVNVFSGILFLASAPDQYLYNPAFQSKLLVITLAGINMLLFYRIANPSLAATEAHGVVNPAARIMAGLSLSCWVLVIVCGRLITYYRPPYHWCLWC